MDSESSDATFDKKSRNLEQNLTSETNNDDMTGSWAEASAVEEEQNNNSAKKIGNSENSNEKEANLEVSNNPKKRPANSPPENSRGNKERALRDTPKSNTSIVNEDLTPEEVEAAAQEHELLASPDGEKEGSDKEAQKTWANVTKRKRAHEPHILFIHKGKDERTYLEEDIWKSLLEEINNRVDQAILEEETPVPIKSNWITWKGGRGIICCCDQETKHWMQATIDTITVDGTEFRAWAQGEFGKFKKVSFYIPYEWGIPLEKALKLIVRQNQLCGEHRTYTVNKIETVCKRTQTKRTGYAFVLGVDEDFLRSLIERGCSVHLRLQKVQIHIAGSGRSQAQDRQTLGNKEHVSKNQTSSAPKDKDLPEEEPKTLAQNVNKRKKVKTQGPQGANPIPGLHLDTRTKQGASSSNPKPLQPSGGAIAKPKVAGKKEEEDNNKSTEAEILSGEEFRQKVLSDKQEANRKKQLDPDKAVEKFLNKHTKKT